MTSSYPIIRSKVRTPPRQRSLVRRQRLVEQIHNNIQRSLILISAGAGYGKTSLLIDYAHDAELPVCWLSLDEHDRHISTFLEYFVASVRERFPGFGGSVLEALSGTGPPEDVEPFVRLFIHELEEKVSQYVVLILDDYHEVADSEPVNAFIDGLLRYLPDHVHLVLASRAIPTRLTLTRLVASGGVTGIGTEDLCFTTAEIYELLQHMGRADLSEEQAKLIAERSEGWITGILLAAHWTGAAQDIIRIAGTMGGLTQYLGELFERQPESVQRFLLGSALLSEMTPPLCDALLGIDGSAQILHSLAEQNLFTWPLDIEGSQYQYHQLFSEFLVSRLERDHPEWCRTLRLSQAELMANRGSWPSAIHGYLSAGAYSEAADAIQIIVQSMYEAGDWDRLKGWIDSLPESILSLHPRLMLFRGRILGEMNELDQASEMLEKACQGFEERGDTQGVARAMVQQAVAQRMRERFDEAIATCHQVLEVVGDTDGLAATLAHHNIGICMNLKGDYDQGMLRMEEALRISRECGDDTIAALVVSDMGAAELTRGKLVNARRFYHQALLAWRKIGNPAALSLALQGLGLIHHHLGESVEAENRTLESIEKARSIGMMRVEADSTTNQADLYRDTGRYDEAVEAYGNALELSSKTQSSRLSIYIQAALGNTHVLKGDLASAHQVLTEASDQVDTEAMRYEAGLCRLGMGMLALRRREYEGAQHQLDDARVLFGGMESKRELARTHLYLAAVEVASKGSSSEEHLTALARLASDLGSHQFAVAEGPGIMPVLDYAAASHVDGVDWTRVRTEIVELHSHARKEGPKGDLSLYAPLAFIALDGGKVLKDGQLVTNWESDAARAMAFLFAAHPSGLSRDRVIGMLWPEVSQAKGNSLFHSTKYRLCAALFKHAVVRQSRVYRINPDVRFRYDALEFDQATREGDGGDGASHIARARAIELYHTPFLEMYDFDWCCEMRQAYQEQVLTVLLDEADYLCTRGSHRDAEALYTRVLGIDSYEERAHRGIMCCRIARNDPSGARRQFSRCTDILREELDVEPSAETLAIYAQVRSQQLALASF